MISVGTSMLLLLFLFHQSTAADVQKNLSTKPIIKSISSCPEVGYFFQRDLVLNAIDSGPCLLCFCKENSSAICWRRKSNRCDQKNYRKYGSRETRYRRSPGFTDIFFRDAARDVFDKRTPEQCKPYESSFSEGCPPADWCIGCTVCDCDANGRWDCHILSFCPDKKGNKQIQKKKRSYKSKTIKSNNINERKENKQVLLKKGQSKKVTIKGKTTKPPKKFINKGPNKASIKRSYNSNTMKTIHTKKITKIKKTTKKFQKSTTKTVPTTKIINKKALTNQQIKINSYNAALQGVKEKNDTYKLAEAIVKKVMSNVEKLMIENKKLKDTIAPKPVQKRSSPKRSESTQNLNLENKLPRKHWIKKVKASTRKPKQPKHYHVRDKRSVEDFLDKNKKNIAFDLTTVKIQLENKTKLNLLDSRATEILTNSHYFKYEINNTTLIPDKNSKKLLVVNNTKNLSKIIINTRFNESIMNITDSRLIKNLTIKEDLITTKIKLNDAWSKLQNILSRGYKHRNSKKYKEYTNIYNIIEENYRNNSCSKICRFKKVIRQIVFGIDANSTELDKERKKKINLVTTLKNFLKPIITKMKPKSKNIIPLKNKKNVLNTLCKKFELCDFDLSDKVLDSKLDKLSHETQNILKIISSLKGLLRLLNQTENASVNDIKDIKKLDITLRNLYIIDESNTNITEATRFQIKYVKQSTQEFVKSLEKFAFTLKDIINTLQKQSNMSTRNNKILHRDMRCTKHLFNNKKQTTDDKVVKLKKLLFNYNFVQNKFLKKMYDTLTSLERNRDEIEPKVSDKMVLNNSLVIDTYSRNIIENLRKLKMLERIKGRVKRAAMDDDDAIEYLLMLMEYLLKQNKSVMNNQVSDGIDLLIDAIKNAPDIKPISFDTKQLTTKHIPTRTTDYSENKPFNKVSAPKKTYKDSYTKSDSIEDQIYGIDKKKYVKGNQQFVASSYNEKTKKENIFENPIVEDEDSNPVQVYFNKNPSKLAPDAILKENIEKKNSTSKYEVYNADVDDEEDDTVDIKPKKFHKNMEDSVVKGIDKEKVRDKIINHINLEVTNEINAENSKETTKKHDWEYDNIDLDRKVQTTIKVTLRPLKVTRTSGRYKDKYANPISGISSEEIDNFKKPVSSRTEIKKIDIFSSFDYNTERTDVDSDSKEDRNYAFSDFV